LTAAEEVLVFDLIPALERIACIDTLEVKGIDCVAEFYLSACLTV
jgi:hypothetical protein